jgi:hypothetical protein
MSVSCARVATAAETAVLGHVWGADGPADRAYVRVARPDGEYVSEVRCGPAGAFYIPVLPGAWSVVCFGPRGYRLEQDLTVTPGDQYDIEFRLDDAA